MKTRNNWMVLLAVLLLVGCGTDTSELRAYLHETDRSREVMRVLADEQLAWRREQEPLVGSADFSWDQARNHFRHIVDSIERESAQVAGLDVPPQAAEFHQAVLSFYRHSADMYRRQFEVMDLLEQMSRLQQQANPDQAAAQAMVDRYEAVQQDLQLVAERIRESAGRSQSERDRLGAIL